MTITFYSCCVDLEDLKVGMGMTNHLEELRKEGGDKWLEILNAGKVLPKYRRLFNLGVHFFWNSTIIHLLSSPLPSILISSPPSSLCTFVFCV